MGLIEKWKKKKEWEKIDAERAAKEAAHKQLMAEAEAEAPRYLDHRIVKMAGDRAIVLCKLSLNGKLEHYKLSAEIDGMECSSSVLPNEDDSNIVVTVTKDGIKFGYNTADSGDGFVGDDFISNVERMSCPNLGYDKHPNIFFQTEKMAEPDEETRMALTFAIRDYCRLNYMDGVTDADFEVSVTDYLRIRTKSRRKQPVLESWK